MLKESKYEYEQQRMQLVKLFDHKWKRSDFIVRRHIECMLGTRRLINYIGATKN